MELFKRYWGLKGIGRGRLGMALWAFEGEGTGDGGGGGSGDAGKGQTGGEGGGSAGGSGTGGGTPPPAEKTFTITVDGQKRSLTESELVTLASKGAGAEKRFEEAAEIRKKAERGMVIQAAVEAIQAGTATKAQVDQMLELMNLEPDQVPNYEGMFQGGTTPPAGKQGGGKREEAPQVVGMDRLDKNVQDILSFANEQQMEKIRSDIERQTREAVQKDAKIGELLSGLDERSKTAVMEELFEMAKQDVREGIVIRNQLFGTEMLDTTIQRLRHRVERLGIPAARASQPSVGSGPMPYSGGYGQYPQMPIPDKPVGRVPVSDPDYITRVTQRALQNQKKAMQSGNWK